MTTAVLAATSGVAADDFIGFDHSCVSWYVAPVGTQSLLIARCYNAQYATSKSDEDIICSQLDLNHCFRYDGYDQLTPKSTPDDTTWYPNNCSQANIEGDSPTDSTTVLATFCNLVAPGFGGIIPTSVDLGMLTQPLFP
ncbi:Uu.00g132660.m01.CDS01 [Anthostomella pinea]|uniref:Uu.00g132660.m01.CDS01 n=1 Tax=Anthostomella pinea TaxID=933095 RepID=A0AAI8YKC2_9PEZI|nr:Uu.00g132660.m01.CDS01 [Anthostomella pinea]